MFTIHLFTEDGIVLPTEQDHSEDDCSNVGLENKIKFMTI